MFIDLKETVEIKGHTYQIRRKTRLSKVVKDKSPIIKEGLYIVLIKVKPIKTRKINIPIFGPTCLDSKIVYVPGFFFWEDVIHIIKIDEPRGLYSKLVNDATFWIVPGNPGRYKNLSRFVSRKVLVRPNSNLFNFLYKQLLKL